MKVDELDIFQRLDKHGKTKAYIRKLRIDSIDRSKMSPARRETLDNFRRTSELAKYQNKRGLVYYKTRNQEVRLIPARMAFMGNVLHETPIFQEHLNQRKLYVQSLWEQFEKSGHVLVRLFGKIVAVLR